MIPSQRRIATRSSAAGPAGAVTTPSAQPQRFPLQPKSTQKENIPQFPKNNNKNLCNSPPQVLKDKKQIYSFTKGKLLGEGGFARCYEVWDQNGTKFAAKVIAKKALKSPKARQKLFSEIRIHQMLKHPNVVRFHHVFEDADNVYMILELCENKTFVDMIKKRKRLTEPEARYYMMQLLEAVQFMHDNKVIHRDLKLGNFFFAQDMQLKIGDFGLAALLMDESERKKTICGTPNYIAPEILFDKGGHSFAVDVWSIGVILYTMLIGRPPFQTKDVKEIYKRIRDNAYEFPEGVEVSPQAINLISSILVGDPSKRPSLKQIMEHNWFKSYIPQSIPVTAFMVPPPTPPSPSFPKPASTVVGVKSSPIAPVLVEKSPVKALVEKLQGAFKKSQTPPKKIPAPLPPASPKRKSMLEALYFNLDQAITCSKQRNLVSIEAAMKDIVVDVPKIFVSKWIDYSNKYGLGYQLTNGSVGVYFNDATSIVMAADCEHFEYLDYASDNKSVMNRHAYTMSVYPDKIQKKVKLLKYFNQFMVENLSKASPHTFVDNNTSNLNFLVKYLHTKHAILFRLSNQVIQVNFFDHTKLILSQYGKVVSFINKEKQMSTMTLYDVLKAEKTDIISRLRYARDVLESLTTTGQPIRKTNNEKKP